MSPTLGVWLKEGDKNSMFFEGWQCFNRRYNHLGVVEVDGSFSEEDLEVRDQVVHFYMVLYQEMEGWRHMVDGWGFATIGESNSLFGIRFSF